VASLAAAVVEVAVGESNWTWGRRLGEQPMMWKALVVRQRWEGGKGQAVAGQKLVSVPVGGLLVAECVE
jgi:hypothetical protein